MDCYWVLREVCVIKLHNYTDYKWSFHPYSAPLIGLQTVVVRQVQMVKYVIFVDFMRQRVNLILFFFSSKVIYAEEQYLKCIEQVTTGFTVYYQIRVLWVKLSAKCFIIDSVGHTGNICYGFTYNLIQLTARRVCLLANLLLCVIM